MRVYVYWNITKGCYSVKHGGLVIAHVNRIVLRNVKFLVGKKGRERVLREGVKNVHAGMSGELVAGDTFDYALKPASVTWPEGLGAMTQGITSTGERVSYNPYAGDSFFACEDRRPVKRASMIYGRVSSDGKFKKATIYAQTAN